MSNLEKCLARINSSLDFADHGDKIDIGGLILNPHSVLFRNVNVPLTEDECTLLSLKARERIAHLKATHDERVLENL